MAGFESFSQVPTNPSKRSRLSRGLRKAAVRICITAAISWAAHHWVGHGVGEHPSIDPLQPCIAVVCVIDK